MEAEYDKKLAQNNARYEYLFGKQGSKWGKTSHLLPIFIIIIITFFLFIILPILIASGYITCVCDNQDS